MEKILRLKRRFEMPLLPLLLSTLVACICFIAGLYGLTTMLQNEPQFTFSAFGLTIFNDSGFLQGLMMLTASIISYVLWFEIGNDCILKN